jgi:hypothetical protein
MSLTILEETCFNSTQQDALYDIFAIAGYLEPASLWEALQRVDLGEEKPDSVFPQVLAAKNFAELAIALPSAQAQMELVLYLAQNGFARLPGVERVELTNMPWMEAHRDEYIGLVRNLGFYDTIPPSDWNVKQIWVLGSGAVVFQHNMNALHAYGEIIDVERLRLLGSDRTLVPSLDHQANIDIVRLATGKDAPNESDMEKVIARYYYPDLEDAAFIYATCPAGKTRADTGDTIHDALLQIDHGKVLLFAGQPFIGRQLLKAQNMLRVSAHAGEVTFSMAGPGITQGLHARYHGRDLAIIHSEIGAYVAECYDVAVLANKIADHKQGLLYANRAVLPPVLHYVDRATPCVGG